MRDMNYELTLTIDTLAPVILAERGGAAIFTGTRDFFSGTVIRGAIARSFLAACPERAADAEQDADFARFVLSGAVNYLPAYPCGAAPVPESLRQSKTTGRVVDLSFNDELGAGYKRLKNFAIIDENQKTISTVNPAKDVELHLSRSEEAERLSGTSTEGHIFNYEALEAGQRFSGRIIGDETTLNDLLRWLEKCGFQKTGNRLSREVSFGRSRLTQYGLCRLSVSAAPRLRELTGQTVAAPSLFLFAQTDFLPSDSLFLRADEAMREVCDCISATVGKQNLAVGKIFATVGETDGFVGVWQLARPQLRQINAGAVVEIAKADESDWTSDEQTAVARVLANGVGRRVVEGYGQWRLWRPVSGDWVCREYIAAPSGEPSPDIHPTVREYAANIIKRRLTGFLRERAIDDVTNHKPPVYGHNHLFSRLESIICAGNSPETEISSSGAARKTLQKLGLWDILRAYPNMAADNLPYFNKLEEFIASLADFYSAIGQEPPEPQDGELMREYWLWFCRAARINRGEGAKK